MEQGIVTNSTKQRIESLEEKLQQIETNIIQEKSKIKSNITEKEIKDYLRKYLKSNPEYMIMKLIDKIVLYNDKIEIIYNSPLTSSDNDKSCQGFLFYKYIYKKILNAYLINHSTIDFSILVLCKMNN